MTSGRVQVRTLLRTRSARFTQVRIGWGRLATAGAGLSYAEVARGADEVLKDMVIQGEKTVSEAAIRAKLEERRTVGTRLTQPRK